MKPVLMASYSSPTTPIIRLRDRRTRTAPWETLSETPDDVDRHVWVLDE